MIFTVDFAAGVTNDMYEVSSSTTVGEITFKGFVRAAIMPLIFGIRCSAIPFAHETTTGIFTSISSTPPAISLSS